MFLRYFLFIWKMVLNLQYKLIITNEAKLVLRLLPVSKAGRTQPKFSFSVIFLLRQNHLRDFLHLFAKKEKIKTADFQLKII